MIEIRFILGLLFAHILVPFWPPQDTQNSIKTSIKIWMHFRLIFGRSLSPFWSSKMLPQIFAQSFFCNSFADLFFPRCQEPSKEPKCMIFAPKISRLSIQSDDFRSQNQPPKHPKWWPNQHPRERAQGTTNERCLRSLGQIPEKDPKTSRSDATRAPWCTIKTGGRRLSRRKAHLDKSIPTKADYAIHPRIIFHNGVRNFCFIEFQDGSTV